MHKTSDLFSSWMPAPIVALRYALLAICLVSTLHAGSYPALKKREGTIRSIVVSGRLQDLRWPNFSDYRIHLEDLYGHAGYAPVWIRNGQPTGQSVEMISILQDADRKGLRAEDYDAASWPARLSAVRGPHTSWDEARFDVALTVCTMRYISDLRIGRINPRQFRFALNVGPKKLDLPALLRKRLLDGNDLRTALEGIEPAFQQYWDLEKALLTYMRLAEEDDGEKLPEAPDAVRPGTAYAGIRRLAELLRRVGDLPETVQIPADARTYEGPLVEALKRFQRRHGLNPDGHLDADTIEQLNVPLRQRVEQIRYSLERYRWMRNDYPHPPVVINIPGFRLYGLQKDGSVDLTMTVDVGQEPTRTPVLEDTIQYVVFRPYWDVPYNIQRDEIVPELKADRAYLAGNNFEIIAPNGKIIIADEVSNQLIQQLRTGRLRLRQKPGPNNSLGLVKLIFPNPYSVYLHDIPSWGNYFADPERSVTHGCIHLEEPAKLAAWALRDRPEWNLTRVQQAMKKGQNNLRVTLPEPIPVLIIYLTAEVEGDGDIYFYPDIYAYDDKLQHALAKGYQYSGMTTTISAQHSSSVDILKH